MTAVRGALFDAGSKARSAAKHRLTAKALRLRQIIVLFMATGMLVLTAGRGMAEDDSRRGAQLAAICASCHRLDGHDKGIPSIVGLDQKEFVDVMAAFKSGQRSSQIMHAIALSLSDGEIVALAAYLAAQPTGTKQR
jgi:cytochrome subunit of sulfide dehydrogenase